MRILVTGANGFLGKHLVPLLQKNHSVLAPSRKELDLIRTESIKEWIKHNEPQAIIHLGAKAGGIGLNMQHPAWLWRDNLLMGIHVLDMAWHYGVKKLVMVGTTCSYPKNAPMPFKEENIWDGFPERTNAAYAIAKRSLLAGAMAYRQEHGVKAVTLIPTNLYGEHDHFEPERSHVIPALIKKFDEARSEVVLWGTGRATRDFLYAGDCAEGVAAALESYDEPEPINLGSGSEISIGELAELVREAMGKQDVKIKWDSSKPDGQPKRVLDTHKAEKFFAWKASTSLKAGLKKTVDWYRCEA